MKMGEMKDEWGVGTFGFQEEESDGVGGDDTFRSEPETNHVVQVLGNHGG